MPEDPIDDEATPYDDALRWQVPSRGTPNKPPYLVELRTAPGFSECQCKRFVCVLEPLLKKGITPEHALSRNLVGLSFTGFASDSLKCRHIVIAERALARSTIKAFCHARKTHATAARD